MKKFLIKLFEPALIILLFAGALLIIALNYFAHLQFAMVNMINLAVGLLMTLLQLSLLTAGVILALLASSALKKYLAEDKTKKDDSCCCE